MQVPGSNNLLLGNETWWSKEGKASICGAAGWLDVVGEAVHMNNDEYYVIICKCQGRHGPEGSTSDRSVWPGVSESQLFSPR